MATELDPQRLHLSRELTRHAMPWIVTKAFDTAEIQNTMRFADDTTRDELRLAAREAEDAVVTAGPEFEALYRLAVGRNGQIDEKLLAKELRRGEWPIRWGVLYERRVHRSTPETLYDAICDWCTVVLRDGVMPELRRVINAHLPGGFSTTLQIGAVPGLLRANDVSFAVRTKSMARFRRAIARTHDSGAIGLAGPRGSGKSTLIHDYVAKLPSTHDLRPLALVVTCPVHYEARDFVLHLHASLCRTVLGLLGKDDGDRPKARKPHRFATVKYFMATVLRVVLGVAAGAAALLPVVRVDFTRPIVPQLTHPPTSFEWWMFPLVLLASYALVSVARLVLSVFRWLVTLALDSLGSVGALLATLEGSSRRWAHDRGVDEIEQTARRDLRRIRVLQTSTTGWSGKLTLPFAPEASTTKSLQLAERPLTYPEVVDAFRGFVAHCVEVFGPAVIAIDEVDKIESTERAQAFINDIKGIFGVPTACTSCRSPRTR
nr:hypothetical protein [Kibdelosporangium sp. MJ126-NF4]CEL22644.1 hypothetical protein [Kibdelosporangium sp. MJ126-NF4]CTQ89785.1 hypothetical protein [Kibdelosporangium sp. MJ126-NF4]